LGCLEVVVRCWAVCDEERLWREPDGLREGAGSPLGGAGSPLGGLRADSPLEAWRADSPLEDARPASPPSARYEDERLLEPRPFGGATEALCAGAGAAGREGALPRRLGGWRRSGGAVRCTGVSQ
jgi:hypothetical protein